jgi:hypothetical protein
VPGPPRTGLRPRRRSCASGAPGHGRRRREDARADLGSPPRAQPSTAAAGAGYSPASPEPRASAARPAAIRCVAPSVRWIDQRCAAARHAVGHAARQHPHHHWLRHVPHETRPAHRAQRRPPIWPEWRFGDERRRTRCWSSLPREEPLVGTPALLSARSLPVLAPRPAARSTLALLELLLGPRMRRSRVSSCFASSTQQMNSLRARGVMSLHASRATALLTSASRRSFGSSCTTPPGNSEVATTAP